MEHDKNNAVIVLKTNKQKIYHILLNFRAKLAVTKDKKTLPRNLMI